MPAAAIPLIINAGMAYAGYSAVAIAAATLVTSVAVGKYEHDKSKRQARRDYNRSLQDRTVTVRSGVSTRKYVVGTHRVGGTLMYVDSIGPNQSMLDAIVALAGNQCVLVGYYFNDEYVAVGDWPSGRYASTDTNRATYRTPTKVGPGQVVITIDRVPAVGTTKCTMYDPDNPWGTSTDTVFLDPSSVIGTAVTVTVPVSTYVEVSYAYETLSGGKLRPQFMSGAADQPASTWSDVAAPGWTVDHKLSGICNIRTLMTWDEKLYASGAPQVSCVLKGGGSDVNGARQHLLYDPRTGQGVNYSDNPAIIALWWMTLPEIAGGCGIPIAMIDLASVSAAANVCDELITVRSLDGGSYQQMPRYQCHSVLDTERSPLENLDIILSSMDGSRAFPGAGGKYRIFAGAWRPAEHTITEDDIVGDADFAMTTGQESAPANICKARFTDYSKGWMESSPPVVRNEAYITADGSEEVLDLLFEATTDPRQANYLMGVALERSRPHFAASLTIGGKGENIAVGDIIEFDIEGRPQYDGKTFEVLRITDRWNGTFEIECVETKPQTWSLDADSYLATGQGAAPDTSYLWNVARVMSLAVSYGEPQVIGGGLTMTRMTITWDQHAQQYVRDTGRIELRYREIGTDEWRGIPEVPGNAVGTVYSAALRDGAAYEVQARARNGTGAVSDWASTLDSVNGVLAAAVLRIVASAIAFRVDAYGTGSPSEIRLSASLGGPLVGPVDWDVVGAGSATLSVDPLDADAAILAAVDMLSDVVSIRASATYRGVTFSDMITIVKVHDGPQGIRGASGAVGSLTGYGSAYGISASAWDDQLANRVIYNMLANGTAKTQLADTTHLLIGDTVTLSNGSDFAETRFWNGVDTWLVPGMVIDGNLLVNGTVSATKITAGTITTGTSGNARIVIGDATFVGALGVHPITSPLHVTKNFSNQYQVLISALNDKDDAAAIWGANTQENGNAVTGTWHASDTDAKNFRWSMLGALGADSPVFVSPAAVAGSAWGVNQAGSFNYYSGSHSQSAGSLVTAFGVAGPTRAAWAAGRVELTGTGSPLSVGGSDGTVGQVLVSRGAGLTPQWSSSGSGGSVDYTDIKTIFGGTTGSALSLTTSFRSTGQNVPASGAGLELAYDASAGGGTGRLTAYDRSASTYKRIELTASDIYLDAKTALDFSRAPGHPTPPTASNTTASATTEYVVSRIAQDAPKKDGTGATGTWNINISGSAGSAPPVGYAQIQTALGGTTGSSLSLTTTFRSTGLNQPASGSGVELNYNASVGGGTGYLVSYDRTGNARKRLEVLASALYLDASTSLDFSRAPGFPTPATGSNTTAGATTAYVVSRIAQDAPTKSGGGASGTWGINISGSAASASTATNATNATNAGNANTVGNIKIKGGSASTGAGGTTSVSTGLSSVSGFSAAPVDGYVIGVTSISGGSVTVASRNLSGTLSGSIGFRWIATGT